MADGSVVRLPARLGLTAAERAFIEVLARADAEREYAAAHPLPDLSALEDDDDPRRALRSL